MILRTASALFLTITLLMFTALLPGPAGFVHSGAMPVLDSLSTTAASPGSALVVTGRNFSAIGSWKAVIELQGG
ncbi:MAG: hypothetical protein PHT96_09610 [Syntrophorhabdaceae bacterium]|nr:hypothetical protein [Syntrophorhabdaceae bacterium]MDD4196651.1 hypothetical protein [Syntrophorhabdaceae bacterium]